MKWQGRLILLDPIWSESERGWSFNLLHLPPGGESMMKKCWDGSKNLRDERRGAQVHSSPSIEHDVLFPH